MTKTVNWTRPLIDECGQKVHYIGIDSGGSRIVEIAGGWYAHRDDGRCIGPTDMFVRNAPERKKVWVMVGASNEKNILYSKLGLFKIDLLDHIKNDRDTNWSTPVEVEIEIP